VKKSSFNLGVFNFGVNWTFVDYTFADFLLAMVSSSAQKGTKWFALPFWHFVVHGLSATLQDRLEAVEQSLA
jgi:hypothetical protein